jgi:hypothetical protein
MAIRMEKLTSAGSYVAAIITGACLSGQLPLRNHHFDSLGLPDSTFRPRLNPIEPPWYATRTPQQRAVLTAWDTGRIPVGPILAPGLPLLRVSLSITASFEMIARRLELEKLPHWPRFLNLAQAVAYMGVSSAVFLMEVKQRMWPEPKRRGA